MLQFAWINGLWGSSAVPASKLKNLMDRIHGQVSSKGIAYVKLQTPGLDAHALLVTETGAIPGGGYRGVPCLQRSGELQRIRRVTELFVEAEGRIRSF